jgi:cytochrome c-type biogenesis protein CcmF
VLILWRLPLLRARTKLESPLSREAAFLYNNLLLVALCLTVLWGVIFPILTELFLGQSRTIGRPYYDFFLRIFGLPLLLPDGHRPLIAWRRASVRALVKSLRWPIRRRVVTGACARCRGCRLVAAGPDRVHVLGLRDGDDRRRVRARTRATGSAVPADRPQPPPLRRLHRATPRSCCSRSGSRARAPSRPPASRSSRSGSR